MNFKIDYYSVLGIKRAATKEEIKAAYRQLAKKHHPDINPGNAQANEKFKGINEPYEVLYNDITRHVYDEYGQNEENKNAAGSGNKTSKRTVSKKTTVKTERRIYVRGDLTVKFWAEQSNGSDLFIMKEVNYKVNPVEATAIIAASDIHPLDIPLAFQRSYRESAIFKSPLPQPINCKIITSTGEELYALSLQEVRVKSPVLSDITKYDKQSLGTLKGEFYAYIIRVDEKEVIEEVMECFGETGNIEKKTEEGSEFYRKEYYYADCSTYWSPWEKIKVPGTKPSKGVKTSATALINNAGCVQWWWLPLLLIFIIAAPQFFLGLLGFVALMLLLPLGAALLSRMSGILPFLALLFLGISLYYAFQSGGAGTSAIVKRDWKPSYDTVKTKKEIIPKDTTAASSKLEDTLISHLIRWKDYDSSYYEVTLSVLASDVASSSLDHNRINYIPRSNTLSPVYDYLERSDSAKLTRIYNAFDSIRIASSLTELQFAKMVVSCVQSIPYYLVLINSCNAYQADEFVNSYLQQCDKECCIGDTKFGVRSPVEFISDLKGDCDTRSLLIYNILKRFNYNIALISSDYYRHAMIAVNFQDDNRIDGLAMNILDKNYHLWETTNIGFKPGEVPPGNRNLEHWDIALFNEKK